MCFIYNHALCWYTGGVSQLIEALFSSRFYNRLPEVKRRREEEEKHQTYTANRERAKQYQQVYTADLCIIHN